MTMRFGTWILAAGAVAACAGSVNAALILTTSTTAPVSTDWVIGQPDNTGVLDNNKDYTDKAPPAQSFTTPNSVVTMTGVTVQGGNSSNGGSTTWVVVISTVGTNTVTVIDKETTALSYSVGKTDYLTFTLNAPIVLAANKQYAFAIYQSQYYYGLAKSSSDVYAGGQAFSEGSIWRSTAGVNGTDSISGGQTGDRTFFIMGTASPVPEPASVGILTLAGLGLLLRRRSK